MNTALDIPVSIDKGIAFLGECMIEISGSMPSPLKLGFAGDTFNSAAYLSRLLKDKGGKVEYLTGLGTDMLSQTLRDFLKRSGVGTSHIRTVENRRPGLYLIETTPEGERIFHYWRGEAAARFFLDNADPEVVADELCGFAALYLSGISVAILTENGRNVLFEALRLAKKRGLRIYFDSNYRPVLWPERQAAQKIFARFVQLTDIAMMTDSDLAELHETDLSQVPRICREYKVPEFVLKQGEKPCIIFRDGRQISVPACRVDRVVDTTAAGDSFNAAYLAARLTGHDPETAALCGHKLAAGVIQQHGAIIEDRQMPQVFAQTTPPLNRPQS